MFKINLDEIGQGLRLTEKITATAFPELKIIQENGELAFETPLWFTLDVKRVENVVVIEGTLAGEATLNCGRCLKAYRQIIKSDFTLKALPQPVTPANYDKDTELQHADLDDLYYEGNLLDLRDVLQEQVILALPLAPLCREDCPGLCPSCGMDLNQGECHCSTATGHPAFAALKDLL